MSGEAIAYEAVDVARMVSELNITERSVARAFCVRGAEDFSLFAKLAAAETFEEVWGLYLAAPSGSEMMEAALAKMEELFPARLAAAETFAKVWGLYRRAPSGSEMEKAALAKMAALPDTSAEAWGLYRIAPSGSEMMEAMLAKMEELFSVRFAAAHTFDEVRELYLSAVPSGSEMRKAALRKLATFFPKKN